VNDYGIAARQCRLYERGIGVRQNHRAAVHWYRLAANQGLVPAQFAAGVMAEQGLNMKCASLAAA
jgi:TPR repeat protein